MRIMTLRVVLTALLLVPCSISHTQADQDQPTLRLLAVPPLTPDSIFGSAWTIYADGPIDREGPQRLANLIAANRIPNGSTIYLNSPGGSLFSGIELGRLIRQHGFSTQIGSAGKRSEWHPGPGVGGTRYETALGKCFSACALTFLGGYFRYANSGDYGVHRFYSLTGGVDSDQAQILSAAVLQYIRDMGVDPALFTEMTRAGRDEMKVLSSEELLALGIINNGVTRTAWTIESAPAGLYMKGERDTRFGYQKLLILCGPRTKLAAMAIFDPQGRQDEATAMSAVSLMIDGEPVKVPPERLLERPHDNRGWVNVLVAIDNILIPRLASARTLGLSLQFTYDAPVFLGIGDMDFTKGAKLLPGFISSCHFS